jgi:FkbM family methyltransferase
MPTIRTSAVLNTADSNGCHLIPRLLMSATNRFLGRICSGLLARFRKMPGRLGVEDLKSMKISFSQHGEDLVILEHLLGMKLPSKGIYIDAGCFDPIVFSNTRLLSLHGWNGLNIDAGDDVIAKFNDARPQDWNVCAALSDRRQKMFLDDSLGSAGRRLYENSMPGDKAEKIRVETMTLDEVLSSSPMAGREVDFLDVDCEGHDLAVLRGFPFDRVRPKLVAIEGHSKEEAETLGRYLEDLDYFKVCVRGPTHIFRSSESVPSGLASWTRIAEMTV